LWRRARFQLGGALVATTLLPFLIAVLISPHLLDIEVLPHSFFAAVGALCLGFYIFRGLSRFPGIQAGHYILPAFASTFAVAITVLFLSRLEYSRPLLLVSFVLCLIWFYSIHFRLLTHPVQIGVVPVGDVSSLHEIENVLWLTIPAPNQMPPNCDIIVADFNAEMPDAWETFLADAALRGKSVLHVRQLRESLTGKVQIERLSENAYGTLAPALAYRQMKTIVDAVLAAIALLVLLPFLVAVGLLVRLSSPGPAVFRQQRVGYRGKPFTVYKFRTMTHRETPDAQSDAARSDAITTVNDVRITPLGRVLRRTRIDELPQLVNVCAGQMSFIGPRPEAAVLSRWYEGEIPFYRYRHIVRPGITGWAQVNQGHVAEVADVHSKLHYDFFYIGNFGLWLDVLIVLHTVRTVVTGHGAR
jgi:lipopolysaccharide/colanic/teichoic acid biosynthesis glycosyltransferase